MSRESRQGIEHYFRKDDTALASTLKQISTLTGVEYRNSSQKRIFELIVCLATVLPAESLAYFFGLLSKLEDGDDMFFYQDRIGEQGKVVKVKKVRTMVKNAESLRTSVVRSNGDEAEDDPRNTKIGKVIRAIELDELPQIMQALKGEISLINIRCLPPYAIEELKRKRPDIYDEWYCQYASSKPGLISLFAAIATNHKNDQYRGHADIFYGRHASLGLDMYILFKTGKKLLNKAMRKITNKVKSIIDAQR